MPPSTVERPVPTLRGHWLIGSLADLQHDYLGTLLRASRELGPVVRVDAGPPGWRERIYSVSSPELAAEVLGSPERFSKDEPGYREVRQGLGNGMLTSEGSTWLRQRRMLAPMFTPRRIFGSYASIMVEEGQLLADRWAEAADRGSVVDASLDMFDLVSRTIGRILFGTAAATTAPLIKRFEFVNQNMLRRSVSPHPIPLRVPTPRNRRHRSGMSALRQRVSEVITDRAERGGDQSDDMLGLLLDARDEEHGGDKLTDDEVIDQVLVFLLAGVETTATTLACALVELARHPSWQQTVRAELDSVLNGRPVAAADASQLVCTARVAREAMRLYPAAHTIGRSPVGDQDLDGFRLPGGSTVVVSTYSVHRSPTSWSDPDEFDPSRFDVPAGTFPGGHKQAWMPYGSGPHTCVGMHLATLEMTMVLATLLQQYQVTTPLTSVPVLASITLKPDGPLPLYLRR